MIGDEYDRVADRVIEQGAPSTTDAGVIAMLTLMAACDISCVLE